jgi:uncharacterized membrane protein YphA (DoxX/SURF4 family)
MFLEHPRLVRHVSSSSGRRTPRVLRDIGDVTAARPAASFRREVEMNTVLWVLQILLAAVFAVSGALKSTLSKPRLIASGQTGVGPFPLPLVRFTAGCELLGAAGMILPRLFDTAVYLTPLAAAGFAVIMVAAIASHAWLREPVNVAATSAILLAALTVCAGRGL